MKKAYKYALTAAMYFTMTLNGRKYKKIVLQHVFHIKKLSLMFKSQIRIPSGDKISKYSLQQSFFLHSTFLKEHMIDHTGERPYEGSHCNFNLWWSNNLVSLGDNSSIHQCEIMFTKTLWSSLIRLAKFL